MLGAGDGLALTVAILLAGAVRFLFREGHMLQEWFALLPLAWWVGAGVARLLPGWGLGAVEGLRRIVIVLGLVFGGALVALFLLKQSGSASRLTLSIAFVNSLVLVPFTRSLIKQWLIRHDSWGVPTVIYGAGQTGRRVIRALREEAGLGYLPVAVYDDDPETWGERVEGLPVLGGIGGGGGVAPVAVVALPGLPRQRLAELIDGPLQHHRQVIIIPDLFEIPSLWVQSRSLGGVLGLEITQTLADPLVQAAKRALELVVVVLTLPLWAPLCLLVAAAIWLEDRHAPFFYQERVGRRGRRFRVCKFRTMVPDAERVLEEHLARDPALRREWETTFKLRQDPRLTRVGRWLRRYSLDELPQLFNVLRGEMSLVGPRPLPAYHHAELPVRIRQLRTGVRPGMTGLWQVSGRSDIGNEGMIRWDAFYVRNWSIWLDVVILVRTLRVVLRGAGAY
ncbi:MAG: undecaprenyl-phosphate galactose phosphotransferase WbaP [Rhodothermaceae bacterium]|nr:MAG: undecaprenyl-phosphate galactose phosphotransferase WbaP [Rhodothermaceae bacterium]